MHEANDARWINFEAAMERVRGFKDVGLEQFVMRGVMVVVSNFQDGRLPETPLDMMYLVDVLCGLYEQRPALLQIMNGEDLRWWGDEDT
jgi:hypothetical protein